MVHGVGARVGQLLEEDLRGVLSCDAEMHGDVPPQKDRKKQEKRPPSIQNRNFHYISGEV